MLKINELDEGLALFHTLGSGVRMQIVQLLAEQGKMNLGAIASALDLTNGAVTAHIRKLEEAGVIEVTTEHSARGMQKVCSLAVDQILFDPAPVREEGKTKVYETEIPVGYYTDYAVSAPCGLTGEDGFIGEADDRRAFSYPDRIKAAMLYFHEGFIEYRFPNLLPPGQRIVQLTLSFEISSAEIGEAAGRNSDIRFSLNGCDLGAWHSLQVDDFARGIYTPLWWKGQARQHGHLKMLVINQMGIFLDGARIREGKDDLLEDCGGELKFRFTVRGGEGGFALYGDHFGNYKQNIKARVHYMPKEDEHG